MTAIEMMKEMQEQLEALNAKFDELTDTIDSHKDQRNSVVVERDALKSKIDFGMQLAREFEEEKEQKIQDDSEALATLYLAHASGGATDGDFKTYCEETCLSIPDELTASELTAAEEVSQEAIAASG